MPQTKMHYPNHITDRLKSNVSPKVCLESSLQKHRSFKATKVIASYIFLSFIVVPIYFFWYIYLKFGAKIRGQVRFLATTLSCTNFWCQTLNICIGEREKGSQQWLYTMQCPSKLDRWFLLFRPPLLAFFTTGDLLQMGKLGRFHSNKNRCCFCNKARAQHCT